MVTESLPETARDENFFTSYLDDKLNFIKLESVFF